MANVLFAFPNLVETAVLSNGRYLATLPRENVKDFQSGKVARTISAVLADTIIDSDLGSSRVIRAISIFNHNLSLSAQIRIRGGEDSTFVTFNYDSGTIDAYQPIYPPGVLAWGDAGLWSGKIGQAELDGGKPASFIHLVSPIAQGRYWRVEIFDASNSDGFVDWGRLWISPGYQPTINMRQGLQIGYETSSTSTETDGGTLFHDARARRRKIDFTIGNIPGDEGFVKLFDIPRDRGTSEPFLLIYDPADTFHLDRRSFFASLRRLNPLAVPFFDHTDQAFSAVEEL